MAFDKRHYKEVKKHTLWMLNNPSVFVRTDCKAEWAITFLPVLVECVESEDYEGAQAMKDAIKEFIGLPADEEILLALPSWKDVFALLRKQYGRSY